MAKVWPWRAAALICSIQVVNGACMATCYPRPWNAINPDGAWWRGSQQQR
jgi:(2Fe-2S) ferredoxin